LRIQIDDNPTKTRGLPLGPRGISREVRDRFQAKAALVPMLHEGIIPQRLGAPMLSRLAGRGSDLLTLSA
jgi:hypothetical protein